MGGAGNLVDAQAGCEPQPTQAGSPLGRQEQIYYANLNRPSDRMKQVRAPRTRLAAFPHRDAFPADDADLMRQLVLRQPCTYSRGAKCQAVDRGCGLHNCHNLRDYLPKPMASINNDVRP